MTFKSAELNYPVHEKELLAIIRALKKWHTDLIGFPFFIYTDHKTLQNFDTQRDLSCRQARWMEFLSQYDGKIVYVKGEDNCMADALSRLPVLYSCTSEKANIQAHCPFDSQTASILETSERVQLDVVATLSSINFDSSPETKKKTFSHLSFDSDMLALIIDGYKSDPWIKTLEGASPGMPLIQKCGNLWFIDERLVIPHVPNLRESIFRLAHDVLGHFGPDKSYESLRGSFYWPNM